MLYGDRAYALVKELNEVRVAGTEAEARAANALAARAEALGAKVSVEEFEIDAYEVEAARLTITAPFHREYAVTGYGLSGCTPPEGIRAPFLYAEDGDEALLAGAKGKIVLLNGVVSAELYGKVVKAGAVGFVAVSGTPVDEADKTDLETRALRAERHLKNGEVAKIPGLTLRAKDAFDLMRGEPAEAEIVLIQREFKAVSRNVVAEIAGTDAPEEWIAFGAHYDSVPFSPGMYDNASGSAILMEALGHYAQNPPMRSLRFHWFGAEEKGLLGSLHRVRAHPEEIRATRLMLNVDLAGQVLGSHAARVSAEECVCAILTFLAQEVGFPISVTQDIFSSDSEPYADAGVPAISLYKRGSGGHNRYDGIELISPRSLDETAAFLIRYSERLIDSRLFPVPPTIPQSIKDKLEVYFGRKPPSDKGSK